MNHIKLDKPDLFCVWHNETIRFEYQGDLIGIVKDNGTVQWFENVKESIKTECRNFIKGVLNGSIVIKKTA